MYYVIVLMQNLAFVHVAFSDHVAKLRATGQHAKLDTKLKSHPIAQKKVPVQCPRSTSTLMDCVIILMQNLAFVHVAFSDHVTKLRATGQHAKLDAKLVPSVQRRVRCKRKSTTQTRNAMLKMTCNKTSLLLELISMHVNVPA